MKRRIALLTAAVLFCLGGGFFLYKTGFFAAASSLESLRAYIDHFTPYSHLSFFLIQFLSVVLAPIPSNITSRDKPAAFRNSGEIRMRPAESISTSDALPRKIRCHTRADIGHAAIFSR